MFFIPIVTPRAVASTYCKSELVLFLAREQALARNDLVFPILYLPVPALRDEAKRRSDRVLTIVAQRQFVDWHSFRHDDVNSTPFGQEIGRFCEKIAQTLHETWISPEDHRELEAEAERRAEDEERVRQEAEAKRRAEERERPRREALAKKRAEEEARERQQAEVKRRAEEEERVRQEVEDRRKVAEQERRRKEALAERQAPLTAVQERALKPGDSFKEGANCPEMIVVPPGRFLMGSPAGRGDDDGRPAHEVTITKPFAVARFALTFDEWDACAARGGCRTGVFDSGWGRSQRPVIHVSWNDAQAYVRWLSSITGKRYRLLSEAEYEYAARAKSRTAYPWGDGVSLNREPMANCDGCGSQWAGKQTAPVGSFPANAFGLYDMIGNVWEWTEDCWNPSYEGAPTDGSPWKSGDCRFRVVRGGSWRNDPGLLRSAGRVRHFADYRNDNLGFRIARALSL